MNDSVFETIHRCCSVLKIDFSVEEFASLAAEREMSEGEIAAIVHLFERLREKKAAGAQHHRDAAAHQPPTHQEPQDLRQLRFQRHQRQQREPAAKPAVAGRHLRPRNIAFVGPAGERDAPSSLLTAFAAT